MTLEPERRRFSVDEFYRMAEAGILDPGERLELLDGAIVAINPIGSRHAGCVNWLTRELVQRLGPAGVVSVQNPLRLNAFSEPQPDLIVLKPQANDYRDRHPEAADVWWVIEVADTSAATDRRLKLPLYAQSGVPEVWLVDLGADVVEVHGAPQGGVFQQVGTCGRGETLELPIPGGGAISTNDVLGGPDSPRE